MNLGINLGLTRQMRSQYRSRVLALGPLAYWPLSEPSGSTMTDIKGGYNGAYYSGTTLGQPGIGDGLTSVLFNGSSGYAQISGANLTALGAAMSVAEFSIMCWLKVSGSGVWTDGQQRRQIYFGFGTETNDHFYFRKQVDANITRCGRAGTTTPHIAIDHTTSTTDWFHVCMTSSISGNAVKFYFNGAQTGSTYTGPQPILGSLATVLIGAASGVYFWSGYMAHVALFSRALSAAEVKNAGTR
jgi:hypothetical protein